jgi:hypothetical protein
LEVVFCGLYVFLFLFFLFFGFSVSFVQRFWRKKLTRFSAGQTEVNMLEKFVPLHATTDCPIVKLLSHFSFKQHFVIVRLLFVFFLYFLFVNRPPHPTPTPARTQVSVLYSANLLSILEQNQFAGLDLVRVRRIAQQVCCDFSSSHNKSLLGFSPTGCLADAACVECDENGGRDPLRPQARKSPPRDNQLVRTHPHHRLWLQLPRHGRAASPRIRPGWLFF